MLTFLKVKLIDSGGSTHILFSKIFVMDTSGDKESGRLTKMWVGRNLGAQGDWKFHRVILQISRIIIVIWFLLDVESIVKNIEMRKVYHDMGLKIATQRNWCKILLIYSSFQRICCLCVFSPHSKDLWRWHISTLKLSLLKKNGQMAQTWLIMNFFKIFLEDKKQSPDIRHVLLYTTYHIQCC